MKKVFLLVWLCLPVTLFGQSTLNFPRLFSIADLAATGFAIVNPGSIDATATFTLYGPSGVPVATLTTTIDAGGQFARLGSELFPTATPGWVQMTSATTGLQGFWIGGDFATFTDGAEASPSAASLLFPLVGLNTEINIANTAGIAASVTISLRKDDGTELGASTQVIAPSGIFQSSAAALFAGVDISQATHILMTGGTSISATAVVSGFLVSPSWGVVNGVDASTTTSELNFPHVIGGTGWLTSVGVTNLSSSANTVTITFTPCPAQGTCPGIATSVQRTLAPNGGLRETAESLFGFSASVFQEGWVKVTTAGGALPVTGFVAYAFPGANGLAIVPAQAAALTSMLFAHIAQEDPFLTGVALLNTSNSTANVEIYAMNPGGTLIGGAQDAPDASFTLGPGAKIARLLNEWIPAAQTNGGFVFVRTTNGVPLYGLELFFLSNLAILANVAPGSLADGITYTPPPPSGPLTLNSVSPTSIARGDTLTLNGAAFSTTPSNNSVVFTTANGTVSQPAATATSTTLTALVPSTAISGPVLVQSGGASSASQILEVTASSSALVQSTVAVSAGQTTTGVDIYVPAPAGTLNFTQIGTGVRPSGFSIASSSVELTQGQTTDLVVAGPGISQANGSTVTVSGPGITLSNVLFSGSVMYIQIDIAANAALGPRTVIVTNSNLDTSVLSGGIIIK